MAALPVDKTDLPDSQKTQHLAVLKTASFNLDVVIDSLQTLDHPIYDDALDLLDLVKQQLNQLQGITEPDE